MSGSYRRFPGNKYNKRKMNKLSISNYGGNLFFEKVISEGNLEFRINTNFFDLPISGTTVNPYQKGTSEYQKFNEWRAYFIRK